MKSYHFLLSILAGRMSAGRDESNDYMMGNITDKASMSVSQIEYNVPLYIQRTHSAY